MFALYHRDPSDLVFYLRDEDTPGGDAPGSRHALRRKYWTYALPIIREAHGETGAFKHVNPSKGSWINGFLGVSGVSICCVANYDGARVEFSIAKSDKAQNKAIYDSVAAHREEIERQLGVSLNWQRSDEIKSSYITYRLEHVSIAEEADWLQMAQFHAAWSKNFYDAIVPYVT